MPLHYTRDGYTFHADPQALTIVPGPEPIALNLQELAQLGLQPADDSRIPLTAENELEASQLIDRILAVLDEAARRCLSTEEAWMAQDLRRAMVLIGGLDEEVARRILDQKRV
jgi:hypothetical protein